MNEVMIKTDAEIDFMRESGKLLAQVFKMLDDFICEGVTFTIEPMINQGSQKVKTKKDGWTVVTLVYFSSSIQNAFQLTYYPDRFADTPEGEPGAQRRGNRRLQETLQVIDDQIASNKWVLGDQFSAADIYLFILTTWLRPARGHLSLDEFPNIKRIANEVVQRPSVQLVYKEWIENPNY